jgi:diguanylate cyclase (GGDEF)-like protein
MNDDDRNGDGPESIAQTGPTEQTLSDADQSASATDQRAADKDQRASDRDQTTADRDLLAGADEDAYNSSRDEREATSSQRLLNRRGRARTARNRDLRTRNRDRTADTREEARPAREPSADDRARASSEPEASFLEQLQQLGAAAAADRGRAENDRANAARERTRLEAKLHAAYLDQLTGAYGRELGRQTLSNEIDRARRTDGRFVLAFVDVDGLKAVNDRDGHAAGDRVLETVVQAIRTRLRSFDPIIRYGGDEFVIGLSGTDLAQAERRFDLIGVAIEADARVSISVGLAALADGDTPDELTERADAAMLEVKATHHSRA